MYWKIFPRSPGGGGGGENMPQSSSSRKARTDDTQQPCAAAYQLWRQPRTSSSSSVAVVDQLFYPARDQASTQSWRTQVYYAGMLRQDRSPESEPGRRVSQGFYGLPLPGLCLAGQTRVRSGKTAGAEASLQKQMHGGGVVRGSWLDFA